MKTDVFLCYRRYGAQTAKLLKRYLIRHNFNGEVWYSDSEAYGNYKNDLSTLVTESECAVLFIDPDFTAGFLNEDSTFECITAQEIVEIIKKALHDCSFRIITVFLDRNTGFTENESNTISMLLEKEGLDHPERAVLTLTQSNMVFFSTATGDEDELFFTISRTMLPDSYYAEHVSRGDFYFGSLSTTADIILWDSVKGINIQDISFEMTPMRIPLYKKIEQCKSRMEFEAQNNSMISLVGIDTILKDETEEKLLYIRYQRISYHLFYKTLLTWEQLELNRKISTFDWRTTDVYEIPNAMGLAFMVLTSDKKMIFTRRSDKRKVRPMEYDCSIVEGLKLEGTTSGGIPYDVSDELYLEYEIKRAFREEICTNDSGLEIRIYGLVLDKKYGQWNLVGTISTSLTSEEIRHLHAMRDDTFEDNRMLYISFVDEKGELSISKIKKCLITCLGEKMWDMALSAVYAALLRVGFKDLEISEMSSGFILGNTKDNVKKSHKA